MERAHAVEPVDNGFVLGHAIEPSGPAVVDMTSIEGKYDIALEVSVEELAGMMEPGGRR